MSIFGAACKKGAGRSLAVPDVCMTPGVSAGAPGPLPYPNNAGFGDGCCSNKVKITGAKAIRKGDNLRMSMGDEAGNSPGGQVSGRFKDSCEIKRGCSAVKVEGRHIGFHTTTVGHNGKNPNAPAGAAIAPCQMKVKVKG